MKSTSPKTAEMLKAPYNYILSEETIAPAIHLLQMSDDSNSVVLSGLSRGKSSLMQLEGLGKTIWEKEDKDQYISRIRKDWE